MVASEFTVDAIQEILNEEWVLETIVIKLYFFALLVSAASIAFGLVSWILIPKWRQFRHYVFLCLLLTNVPGLFVYMIQASTVLLEHSVMYSQMAFTNWLMIATVMFYSRFIKVFKSLRIFKHAYLQANVFGWLVPLATLLLTLLGRHNTVCCITFALLFLNSILYLSVLFALYRRSEVFEPRHCVRKKAVLSTLAFSLAETFICLPLIVLDDLIFVVFLLVYVSVILFINTFFLMLKSHRRLWCERSRYCLK